MTSTKVLATILFYSYAFFSLVTICYAVDTISANQTIRDGETIVSASEYFELGFFTIGNSSQNRYLGIRYKRLAAGTVIWVANKETPITNSTSSAVLQLGARDGVLQLRNGSNGLIWSSSNSSRTARNAVARLLDTGNLVIRDESDTNPESYIWQSFDHPGDTFMPAMKLGRDLAKGIERNITSWRRSDDPSPGEYSIYMDFNGYPQVFEGRGTEILYRLGFWNGLRFTGVVSLRPNPIYTFEFVFNEEEIYYKFDLINTSVLTKMRLGVDGNMDRLNWNDRTQNWSLYSTQTIDICVRYALCGAHGTCNIDASPICGCLEGFEPKNRDQWRTSDWKSGCTRRVALDCGSGEGFRKYEGFKLPDTRNSWFNRTMSLDECETRCKSNCTCTAYSTLDIRGEGSGCLLWFGDLIDMKSFSENGQDIYIRMAPSELAKDRQSSIKPMAPSVSMAPSESVKDRRSSIKRRVRTIVIPIVATLTLLLGLCLLCAFRRRNRKGRVELEQELQDSKQDYSYESQKNDLDLPLFSFSTLLNATNHFSLGNKLGEGGYGPVYKGVLEEGQEIAVKRLSKTSTQGIEEFKNEVICVNKLQHRNLVKLLGCCIQGNEKMLVYEYMPNKSLDSFLFDETRNRLLDWPKRFHIIKGIARGLLYLHQDSRLRIIHRDLKAGNILLDFDMNAKISDFGMARSFGGNETEANTMRVVGTYGYMAPEYAGDGIFSTKSDAFSFGVLVLEIVSGKKNRGFYSEEHHHNLLGHAWRLHNEGRSLELLDSSVSDSAHTFQALRLIHVGLLCVQQSPEDRPSMSSVATMLTSEGKLPEPQQPGFYHERNKFGPEHSSSMLGLSSTIDTTITQLEPR